MTPDRLVQAAAEAMARLNDDAYIVGWENLARIALAAAFAALPECEETAVTGQHHQHYYYGWNDCLAALAREFGEPT